ncbi:hypothetical protein [Paenibacillus sp. sgz500958]|uniref:hypothetical protein n=1 Tax=Paenibacillus sp. sgz500958 TaxID=3242475 RepID=UPI0036D3BFCB
MRHSPKAWIWRNIPPLAVGSSTEAWASAKSMETEGEILNLKGKGRNLLPRT